MYQALFEESTGRARVAVPKLLVCGKQKRPRTNTATARQSRDKLGCAGGFGGLSVAMFEDRTLVRKVKGAGGAVLGHPVKKKG